MLEHLSDDEQMAFCLALFNGRHSALVTGLQIASHELDEAEAYVESQYAKERREFWADREKVEACYGIAA